MFTIFVRNWYKYEYKNTAFGGIEKKIVPNPGARRTIIATRNTEQEARDYCQDYNDTHKPGPLSRKAEYTSDF